MQYRILVSMVVSIGASLAPFNLVHAQSFAPSDLAALTIDDSHGLAISNVGRVVGYSQNDGNTGTHAAVWDAGYVLDLGTLGGQRSVATSLSSNGLVAGFSQTADGVQHAALWYGAQVFDLGTLGGPESFGMAVNSSGAVAGTALTVDGTARAALWAGGTVIDLGTLGGSSSGASAINDAGQIVGGANLAGDVGTHAALWQNGQVTDLGTIDGNDSQATSINNLGQVVGFEGPADGSFQHAALWTDGGVFDLGTLGGSNGWAMGINDLTWIVGSSQIAGDVAFHATLWSSLGIVDLNAFLSPEDQAAGWVLTSATGINNLGQITGDAHNDQSDMSRAFILEPVVVPEPATWAMFALGLMMMCLATWLSRATKLRRA